MAFSYMYSMYFDSTHPLVNLSCALPSPADPPITRFPDDPLSFLLF